MMDIRKFFGGGSSAKSSEKANTAVLKNADAKNVKQPQTNSSTSNKSPKSPSKPSKARKTQITTPTKTKVEVKSKTKQNAAEDQDLDNEDFVAKNVRKETALKSKENKKHEGKDKSHALVGENVDVKHKEKSLVGDAGSYNNNNNKNSTISANEPKSNQVKKRKRDLGCISEDSSEEEESPISKRKPASKSNRKAVIYDSDSDEDPLPKSLRDKSPNKKRSKKHDIEPVSDHSPRTILDAFNKAPPKNIKESKQSALQSSSVKQPINANDFFGVTPVHRTESRQPVKMDSKKDSVVLDDEAPTKKMKLDEGNEEVKGQKPGLRLAEKLAAKKNETTKLDSRESESAKDDSHPQLTAVTKTTAAVSKSPQKTSPEKLKPREKSAVTTPTKKVNHDAKVTGSSEKGQAQRRGSGYFAFRNREPPKFLGSKELPEGADNCLEGLTFVITGVLESIERDEAKTLVERYGGKVMQNVSKNTKYLVLGRDGGEAKTSKAQQLGIKQLDEDGLFDLIRTLPGKKSKYEVAAAKEEAAAKKTTPAKSKAQNLPKSFATPDTTKSETLGESSQKTLSPEVHVDSCEALMWVDRYKPTSSKQIIGQQGDKSNANKLLKWLTTWHKNLGKKPAFGRASDDGAGHKAALLSGPPGVGKTTTAQVICKEAGFSFVELNASDTRSKRSLKEDVAEALGNHTLVDFFGHTGSQPWSAGSSGQKHCLIMDEVDGMAGNEDRGGMQELIQLIKQTKIPIICMCNDRNHPKVRSLSNYCFDLRFQRPRIEQIKGAMMSIAFKEGLKIPPPALNDIILAANQDIRQVLHNLSMWTIKDKSLTYEQLKAEASKAQKDLRLGPFDVCRKVFVGGEETNKMTIIDKSDLFFHDYSIGPLFVQENYIHVSPFGAQGNTLKHLRCLSRAADSIATGDLVDGYVRRGGSWNLLPTQAIFASVIPGEMMRGSVGQMIQFPSWLGKNSTTNKNDRLRQELRTHARLNISADKRALGQDYLPTMRLMLTSPLIDEGAEGVKKVVSVLNAYDLTREDFDSVIELTSWPGMKDPMSQVDSKVKAAFTRTFNKEVHLTPYATGAAAKKGQRRGGMAGQDNYDLEMGEEEVDAEENEHSGDEENESVATDTMIKAKKAAPKSTKNSSSQDQSEGASGKGKGKGKGKNVKNSK